MTLRANSCARQQYLIVVIIHDLATAVETTDSQCAMHTFFSWTRSLHNEVAELLTARLT